MYETTKDYNGCGDYGFFYPYYAEVIANDYCGDIVIPDKIHYSWVDSDDCYNIYYRDQDVVVKYIHSNAFAGCTNLTSITIPKSIISWGERYEPLNDPDYDYNLFYYREIPCSFRGCINLNSIIIDGDNEIYEVRNNCIVKKATNKLFSCYKSGSIDSSITSIGAHAFNLTGLTSIVIPESIQSIESSAFYYCSDLIYVQVLGSPNGGNVFYG